MSAPTRSVQDELRSLSAAVANLQTHLGMVARDPQQARAYHIARIDALRDVELRLNALASSADLSDVARLWRARRDLGPHSDPRYRPNQRVGAELAQVLDRIAGADG